MRNEETSGVPRGISEGSGGHGAWTKANELRVWRPGIRTTGLRNIRPRTYILQQQPGSRTLEFQAPAFLRRIHRIPSFSRSNCWFEDSFIDFKKICVTAAPAHLVSIPTIPSPVNSTGCLVWVRSSNCCDEYSYLSYLSEVKEKSVVHYLQRTFFLNIYSLREGAKQCLGFGDQRMMATNKHNVWSCCL